MSKQFEPRPLKEQVVVITGASSGIGLATARLAAKRGARVVLASRSRPDLRRAVKLIRKAGGEATYVVADVADAKDVQSIADEAVKTFGGIDTWVNNAGVSIYGRLEEVSLEDARRLFETNYWGVVNGSLVAAEYMRETGGTVINVGSVLSDVPMPLQGHYAASKHAVKGFTDSLRVELEQVEAPVAMVLVKPSSIDTPYTRHARNYMESAPNVPPPVYAPRVVARAILRCAEKPRREVTVGGGGRVLTALGGATPRLLDRYLETVIVKQQKEGPGPARRRDSLHRPRKRDGAERGEYEGHVMRTSAYTDVRLHPVQTMAAVALLGAGVLLALRRQYEPVGPARTSDS